MVVIEHDEARAGARRRRVSNPHPSHRQASGATRPRVARTRIPSVNFTVTARASARRFAYQHASVLNALDQGMSLIAAGMADVRVVDGSGLARTPADLYRQLFGESGGGRVELAAGEDGIHRG
jgi:hypothetical protein